MFRSADEESPAPANRTNQMDCMSDSHEPICEGRFVYSFGGTTQLLDMTNSPQSPNEKPLRGESSARVPKKVLVIAIIAAVAGYLAVWIPWHLAGSHQNMVDGMRPISLLYLVLVGFGCGLAAPHRFWVAGLASMALFPFMAIVGAVRDPTSHNLLVMEFVIYGFLTLPAILGGALGKMIRAVGP